ncbi:MAG TPA: sulfite exporter TauE/SafE family protein [Xanthobacteraceae bacterium]|nr:sulfite exporter TauE/SafE family protein [Xanthobacteraceae bacterium]
MGDVPIGELAVLATAVAGGGILTGLMAGLFGIGGGAVIVPVLFEVFGVLGVAEDVRMQLCIGTSLAIIVPTTFRSYFTHRSKNIGLDDVVRKWTVPAIAGVATGAAVAAVAPAAVFKVAFAVTAAVIAVKLLFGRDSWRVADDLPRGPILLLFGYLIGLSSSLMGVSGGSVANIIMMLYGKTIHTAVATSAGLGVPIAVAGTIGFMLAGLPHQSLMPPLSIGYVSLVGFAVMAPISSYVAGFGARLAHKTPRRRLEIVFGLFLAIIAVRFMVASIG